LLQWIEAEQSSVRIHRKGFEQLCDFGSGQSGKNSFLSGHLTGISQWQRIPFKRRNSQTAIDAPVDDRGIQPLQSKPAIKLRTTAVGPRTTSEFRPFIPAELPTISAAAPSPTEDAYLVN
jgi:hypothetical protein